MNPGKLYKFKSNDYKWYLVDLQHTSSVKTLKNDEIVLCIKQLSKSNDSRFIVLTVEGILYFLHYFAEDWKEIN